MWRSINNSGFTLMEVLVTGTLGALLVVTIYMMFETNQSTFNKGETDTDLQQNARVAMDRLVRELRMVRFDPQATPIIPSPCATAIQSATSTSIRFIGDVDPDPIADYSCPSPPCTERVEYTYDAAGKRIRREEWPRLTGSTSCVNDSDWSSSGGAHPLAEKISGLTFAYYDANNNPITAPVAAADLGNIRRITITLTTSATLPREGPRSYAIRSEVRPRNLGL